MNKEIYPEQRPALIILRVRLTNTVRCLDPDFRVITGLRCTIKKFFFIGLCQLSLVFVTGDMEIGSLMMSSSSAGPIQMSEFLEPWYIWKIEMVQCRVARYVSNRYHNTSSVATMLDHLEWETLDARQTKTGLSCFFLKSNMDLSTFQQRNTRCQPPGKVSALS